MAGFQTGLHGGSSGGFHANDFHMGVKNLSQSGNTGNQTAAAHGSQDGVHIGEVLKDLIGNGALTGGQGQIVEGMNVGQSLILR